MEGHELRILLFHYFDLTFLNCLWLQPLASQEIGGPLLLSTYYMSDIIPDLKKIQKWIRHTLSSRSFYFIGDRHNKKLCLVFTRDQGWERGH